MDSSSQNDSRRARTLWEVLDRVEDATDGEETSVADVVRSLGTSSFTPFLLVPALLVATPLSGIPLFSSVCGITIALVATQKLVGRDSLWLPGLIRRRAVGAERMQQAVGSLRGVAQWLDRHRSNWFKPLVQQPFVAVLCLVCVMCGGAMPFLELVPFTSSLLAIVVVFVSVAMFNQDGLLAVIGLIIFVTTVGGFVLLVT